MLKYIELYDKKVNFIICKFKKIKIKKKKRTDTKTLNPGSIAF